MIYTDQFLSIFHTDNVALQFWIKSEKELHVTVQYGTISVKQIEEIALVYYHYCFSKNVDAILTVQIIPKGHTNESIDTYFSYVQQLSQHHIQMYMYIRRIISKYERFLLTEQPPHYMYMRGDFMSEWPTKVPHTARKSEYYEPGKY